MLRLSSCLILIFLASSCITNKKLVYLQKDDVNEEGLSKGSVVRSYDLEDYEYKIQPQDALSITVNSLTPSEFNFFNNNLSQGPSNLSASGAILTGERVDENGEIEFPVVGKVPVATLTIREAQEVIRKLAEPYLQNPVVKVKIVNFRFTILGEVNIENTITTLNNKISIMEAIGLAGGFSELADRASIKLVRHKGSKTEVQYLNLLNEDLMATEYFYIHQNDLIIVPPLKQRAFRRYFGSNVGILVSSLSTLLLVINLLK